MGKVGIEGWWHAWFHGQEVGMKNVVQRERKGGGKSVQVNEIETGLWER